MSNVYLGIAIAAYAVVLFLTLRDIRIFRRTGIPAYRKGALKGIAVSSIVLIGIIVVNINPELGLLIVFIGIYLNKKGIRENVFDDADTMSRLLGKTDRKKT
ncbi:MAG: hypothetical protein ACXQTE_06495 [Methanosarcinaceae archaeon]